MTASPPRQQKQNANTEIPTSNQSVTLDCLSFEEGAASPIASTLGEKLGRTVGERHGLRVGVEGKEGFTLGRDVPDIGNWVGRVDGCFEGRAVGSRDGLSVGGDDGALWEVDVIVAVTEAKAGPCARRLVVRAALVSSFEIVANASATD